MTPEQWQEVKRLFLECCELPVGDRAAFLDKAGVGGELRAEVERMLANDEEDSFLETPAVVKRLSLSAESMFGEGDVLAGRFRIVNFIGRGGMGEVYRAHDEEIGEAVALKVLSATGDSAAALSERFRRELQMARRVTHPNACRLFDFNKHSSGGTSVEFLTMELLDGQTLSQYVKEKGPMAGAEAIGVLRQIAEALDAAHAVGVIHRDLKPSNVMIASGGRAVVTDFGLARTFAAGDLSLTKAGQVAGTLEYMAPELMQGAAASVASDIFAFGKTALYLMTGSAHVNPDSKMPADVKRAIEKALHPDPSIRFASAGAFVDALAGKRIPALGAKGLLVAAVAVAALFVGYKAGLRFGLGPSAGPDYMKGVEALHSGAYYAATKAFEKEAAANPRYPMARARLAEAWAELMSPERASREMLLARREGTFWLSKQEQKQLEAIDLLITRDFKASLAKYVELAGADWRGFALDLARAYERASQRKDALPVYLKITAESPENPMAWLRLGGQYSLNGEKDKAREAFDQAERIYQGENNLEGLVEVAFRRGVEASRRKDYEAAVAHFSKARDTARMAGNVFQEVSAVLQMAHAAYAQNNPFGAKELARTGLELAQANQIEVQAVVGLLNLGNAARLQRDYGEAERYYRNALEIAQRSNSLAQAALIKMSLAAIYDDQKNGPQLEHQAKEALSYFLPNNWVGESIDGLLLLGRHYRRESRFDEAIASFREGLGLAEKAGLKQAVAIANAGLASVDDQREMLPQALAAYQRNLAEAEKARRAFPALQAASMAWRLGEYSTAESLLTEAIGWEKAVVGLRGLIVVTRTEMAASLRKAAEAEGLARLALEESGNSVSARAQAERLIGSALISGGRFAAAVPYCERAVEGARQSGDKNSVLAAKIILLQARVGTGNRAAAEALFREIDEESLKLVDSRVRATAWMTRLDRAAYLPKLEVAARAARAAWGENAWKGYASRPDMREILAPIAGN